MSCQQNQQQCQPPPKCPSPKCPPKSPAQCLPPASSCCAAPSPGGCGGPSSEGSCCLCHHRRHRSHRCRRQRSNSCDKGSGQQDGASSCGYGSGGCC
ncbi:late cornified envelope protein 3B-like [Sapajus apella]|uniref:Late cornified envelope protein 3B-like n=1 Tax=Sapajus apella TaxID=9515 RepID=A0A6J3HC78_SAPAP|nr:late cornified envelope protein 3B-like [Sapajus apella]